MDDRGAMGGMTFARGVAALVLLSFAAGCGNDDGGPRPRTATATSTVAPPSTVTVAPPTHTVEPTASATVAPSITPPPAPTASRTATPTDTTVPSLTPTATPQPPALHGRVTDADGGPLAGVMVTAFDDAHAASVSVFTDVDGRYDFPPLTPGAYRLRARRVGWRDAVVEPVVVSAEGASSDFSLALTDDLNSQLPATYFKSLLQWPSAHVAPTSTAQVGEHPSHASALPSSQPSLPQRTPSPQPVSTAQSAEQPSQSVRLPSSHASPLLGTSVPLGSLTGSMELVGGTIGAGGIAPVEVAGPVFYTAPILGGQFGTFCVRIESCTGMIDCDGGTPVDVLTVQDSNGPGHNGLPPTITTGMGVAPAGAVQLDCQQSYVQLGPGEDCAAASYPPPARIVYTTGTAEAFFLNGNPKVGTGRIAASGEPFSCSAWQTTDGPGQLAGAFMDEENPQAGDTANLTLIDD